MVTDPKHCITFVTRPSHSVIIGAGLNHGTIFSTVPNISAQTGETTSVTFRPEPNNRITFDAINSSALSDAGFDPKILRKQ